MVKLSNFHFNYRLDKYVKDAEGNYRKVFDRMYSQLEDIKVDFPELTLKDLRYLARHHSTIRHSEKFKGLSIMKIYPISKY